MEQKNLNSILKYVLKSKYSQFLGIFSLKEFNFFKIKKKHCVLIIFIDIISSQKFHWVTILKNGKTLYFIDSYGLKPDSYMKKNKNQYLDIKYYFPYRLQSNYSTICGVHTIFLYI